MHISLIYSETTQKVSTKPMYLHFTLNFWCLVTHGPWNPWGRWNNFCYLCGKDEASISNCVSGTTEEPRSTSVASFGSGRTSVFNNVKHNPVVMSGIQILIFVFFTLFLGKDSFNMDRTLTTDFAESETVRDSKMLLKGLLNNLKYCIDFQN